jgi:hypothetical protein
MTKEYRYILDKSNKKHPCPECNKKTFVLYIDIDSDEYLPEEFGRCDRESKCAYHLNPYRDGYANMIRMQENGNNSSKWKPQRHNSKPKSAPEPVFIPKEVLKQTLQGYEKNVFIQNLLKNVAFPFEQKDIERVIAHYYLGTICEGYRAGGITFPFIDKNGNVRAVQVKQFDKENHTTGTDFLHTVYSKPPFIDNSSPFDKKTGIKRQILPDWIIKYGNNDLKVSCLFGEHLLTKYPSNPIALVEAPKTAIYGTLYFGFPEQPENLLWLAVYNLSSLSLEKCQALQGRDVYLFPDLSKDGKAFQCWSNKAKRFSELIPGTRFEVSTLLETVALNELKEKGADIADILIKMNWRKFRPEQIKPLQEAEKPTPEPQPEPTPTPKSEKGENSDRPNNKVFLHAEPLPKIGASKTERIEQPKTWEQDITELENYFAGISLPTQPVNLNKGSTITNCSLFIKNHLATVKANNGNRKFLPYLSRLRELKQVLTTNLN